MPFRANATINKFRILSPPSLKFIAILPIRTIPTGPDGVPGAPKESYSPIIEGFALAPKLQSNGLHPSETIRDPDELARFLGEVDNLVEIAMKPDELRLSGRRYREGTFRLHYRRVDLDDVRVLYRAYLDLAKKPDQRLDDEGARHADLVFSLDPWIAPRRLAASLRLIPVIFQDIADDNKARLANVVSSLERVVPFAEALDDTGFLRLLIEAENDAARNPKDTSRVALAETLKRMKLASEFQSPRYEGETRGTEVGNTMYLTDLAAKLYDHGVTSFDRRQSYVAVAVPEVPGSIPTTEMPAAPFLDINPKRGRSGGNPTVRES